MITAIQAIRGMNDILPSETQRWRYLEKILRTLMANYSYEEIRFPVVEKTELFKRSIGEVTDIVEKEMYTFLDRNGDSLTLRPEGTAVCVRAAIEHGLLYNQLQRLWYMGPMFRHERPQKGRYRQFFQLGVEAFGMAGPDIDAELIFMTARLWQVLKLTPTPVLHVNSLGSAEARLAYRDKLLAYFAEHFDALDEDSKRRLHSNPLRILDSKNPSMQALITQAPRLTEYLDDESQEHFQQLCSLLKAAGLSYVHNERLVRGLDYYNRTVFEWITGDTAQSTVCAGGRYDGLVAQLGGQPTQAVGFAIGIERLLSLISLQDTRQNVDAYLIMAGREARNQGLYLAEKWRNELPNWRLRVDCGEGGFKNQFKRADKSGATIALILGDDELASQTVTIKYLREERVQEAIAWEKVVDYLNK